MGQDRKVPAAHAAWLASHVAGATTDFQPERGHFSLAVDGVIRAAGPAG